MYPKSRTTEAVVEVAGVAFPDPYQWLEESSPEVEQWQDEQAELADAYVRQWPHFETLRQSVRHFFNARSASYPSPAGRRWVRSEIPAGATQAQVILSGERFGPGEVIFDAATENPELPPFVSWVTASPDGRYVAIGVCDDGSERNTIRLLDTATGDRLPAPDRQLLDNWTGGARWLPDSSGFLFTSVIGESTELQHEVLHFHLDSGRTTTADVPWLPDQDYRTVLFSTDGKRAVAVQHMLSPIPVAVAELPDLEWRPFVTAPAVGGLAGQLVGDHWIAVSDLAAPRGRVVAIAIDNPTPADPSTWDELVPESDVALRSVTPVGDHLYVLGLDNTYTQVRIFTLDGKLTGHLPLPGRGAVIEHPFPLASLYHEGRDDEYAFAFTTLTTSAGYYRHQPGSTLETLAEPKKSIPDTVVEDGWATSPDGTRIPYHLVRRRDLLLNEPRPTLVYGYGGFNAPWHPVFLGPMAAFVDSGGVLVHTHLRGGGEFGRNWWDQGRLKNKKNSYDDLHAIAGDLVATGVTSPNLLGVTGGSNGGLMAGVAATLRPDLWAVAVPRVPLLDVIGATRQGYGRYVLSLDFADLDDPDDVRRLASLSPYHLIQDGIEYPAVYLDSGDTDPRCPPWHARKFAARLQAATTGPSPVLLRIWRNVGHGWATDQELAVLEHTSWLAFVMKQFNMLPRTPRPDQDSLPPHNRKT